MVTKVFKRNWSHKFSTVHDDKNFQQCTVTTFLKKFVYFSNKTKLQHLFPSVPETEFIMFVASEVCCSTSVAWTLLRCRCCVVVVALSLLR